MKTTEILLALVCPVLHGCHETAVGRDVEDSMGRVDSRISDAGPVDGLSSHDARMTDGEAPAHPALDAAPIEDAMPSGHRCPCDRGANPLISRDYVTLVDPGRLAVGEIYFVTDACSPFGDDGHCQYGVSYEYDILYDSGRVIPEFEIFYENSAGAAGDDRMTPTATFRGDVPGPATLSLRVRYLEPGVDARSGLTNEHHLRLEFVQ